MPETVGRYAIVGEIARGGMGVVYAARDLVLDRDIGLKTLRQSPPSGSPLARRFREEARITGQLQHPGIPPVHDLGALADGRPFLAMKLIKGRTLADLLGERPGPSHDRARFVAVFEQICQAVGYAHAHQVIHRDLKPANVMVGAFGEVQVMDWGLAKVLTEGRSAGPGPEEAPGTEIRSVRDAGEVTQAGAVVASGSACTCSRPWLVRILASPQSMTWTSPKAPTITLAGFKSRWMMPRLWAKPTA